MLFLIVKKNEIVRLLKGFVKTTEFLYCRDYLLSV